MSVEASVSKRDSILDPAGRLRALSEIGSSVIVDYEVPIQRYLRSGPQMERMAKTYYAEGQWEQAFILYNKFATLFVEKLPKHPGWAKAPASDKSRVKKLLKPSFDRALELKNKMKEKYEEEKEEYCRQKETEIAEQEEAKRKFKEEQERIDKVKTDQLEAFLAANATPTLEKPVSFTTPTTGFVASDSTTYEPHPHMSETQPPENQPGTGDQPMNSPTINIEDVEMQESEEGGYPEDSWTARDDMLLLSNNQPYLYDDEEEYEREETPTSNAVPMATSEAVSTPSSQVVSTSEPTGHVSLTATDANLSKVLPGTFQFSSTGPQPIASIPGQTSAPPVNLPTAGPLPYQPPPSGGYQAPPSYHPHPIQPNYNPSMMPPGPTPMYQPPPTYSTPGPVPFTPNWGAPAYYQNPHPIQPPSQIPHNNVPSYQPYPAPPTVAQPPPPSSAVVKTPPINRDLKPHVLTSLGGLEGIRPVIIPGDTVSRFQQLASGNTRRDVETCGILAGKLAQNKLSITYIIVPKQRGKSDSCETLNEEELFDVQDKHDLIQLGWIHTHPSQTSFMSSVDLHTHCSYQLMLEEAIAIVCAPRYNQVGIYTLTQPHGLNFITKCSGKGFHTHPKEPPLYEACKHIQYDKSTSVKIVDLR